MKKLAAIPKINSESVRVEKIANGFLAHHTKEGPSGFNTKTVFHPQKPALIVPKAPTNFKKGGK